MNVVLSPRALQRLQEIYDYISLENQPAALQVISRIRQVIDLLGDFPELGRVWEDGTHRAISVSGLPYRIHYRINHSAETVEVITVAHMKQLLPPDIN